MPFAICIWKIFCLW